MKAIIKSILVSVCINLVIVQSVLGQESASTCQDPSRSLLWEVRGEHSRVFLFGSIHLGNASFYPLHETIETALRESNHVVFEVDPAEMSDPNNALKMQQLGMLPAGQSLETILSPKVLADLRTQLTTLGLPTEAFMGFRPWMVTLALTSMQMMSLGYNPDSGVESYVTRRQPATAETLALETMDSQLGYLQELDGEAFLAYTLANFDAGQKTFQQLVEAWRCADKQKLEQLFEDEFSIEGPLRSKMDNLREKLLYERNREMANKIKSFVRDGTGQYFVVIGTAHYLGDKSIIDLLKKRGYQVKPVLLN